MEQTSSERPESKQQQTQKVYPEKQQKPQQKTGMVSIRQNFSEESENLINQLINNLYFGYYTCTSMAYYFDRAEIGLFGLADFFKWCSLEAYQCARLLADYIVVRGGEVEFETIKKPEKNEWGTPLDALQYLIDLKKVINQQVLKVHTNACEQVDPHLTDFLESTILRPLVEFLRKVGVLVANLERAGPRLGEYQFNKDLELHLREIMRDTKLSYSQLPITAVGSPVGVGGFVSHHGHMPSFNPYVSPVVSQSSPVGPATYLPGVGLSTIAGSTPNFNLADVINLVSNIGLSNPMSRSSII